VEPEAEAIEGEEGLGRKVGGVAEEEIGEGGLSAQGVEPKVAEVDGDLGGGAEGVEEGGLGAVVEGGVKEAEGEDDRGGEGGQ